jgi:sulfur-oxidizing protein SoxY
MTLSRREFVVGVSCGLAVAAVSAVPAQASLVNETISKFTGGAEVVPGDIILDTPEIAENGNTVPIDVSAPGAASIMLLAAGNPVPAVATFNFGPLSGSRSGNTRIRLIKTQEVMAIAKMEDGSFKSTQATVKVTIGGCGG